MSRTRKDIDTRTEKMRLSGGSPGKKQSECMPKATISGVSADCFMLIINQRLIGSTLIRKKIADKTVLPTEDLTDYQRLTEGAWIIYRQPFYYLFYSGDNCCGDRTRYAVQAARAKMQPDLLKLRRKARAKRAARFLSKTTNGLRPVTIRSFETTPDKIGFFITPSARQIGI